jgi:restriction endonuclease S subunit
MSSYLLKSTFDENRMFIIQKIDINKRLDPFFYSPLNRLKILEKTNLPKKKLSEVAELKRGKFSHRPRNDERFFGGDYPFIQTGEIVKASNNYGKIQYSQTLNELGLSVSKLFDKDVLLITIAANIGDTAILDYPACFPDSMVAISSKDENVSLKYLNVYFKFLKKYLENLAPSAAQKNLTLEQLAPTPVILPTLENQNKIVDIFDTYVSQKQTNEAEAEKLLASIDDYLLKELGITLPTPPENTLKNRIFTTTIKEISGGRFDPKLYSLQSKELIQSIYKTKFKYQSLKSTIVLSNAGDWGLDDKEKFNDEEFVRCLVIRATEFDNKFNLKIDGSRAKFRLIDKLKYKLLDVQPNDLLIEKSGGSEKQPVGRVAILTSDLINENSLGYSNFVHKIRVDETIVLADYVFNFLKTLHNIKITDVMQSQTNGIKNLILGEYFNLPIPVPPLDKQKEIADHITSIRNQAQALKDITKDLLKKASEEIEEILLN